MKSVLQFLGGAVGWIAAQSGLLGALPHGVQVGIQAVAGVATVLGIRNAAQTTPTVAQWLDKAGGGWKTVAGVLVALVGTLLAPDVLNLLSPQVAHVAQVAGTVLAALGLYHAQTKAPTS